MVAHDMAFRLLAEMRINVFRKLDNLAPAYLVRRRTGDLMGIATQDVELVEYFLHYSSPLFLVSILVPVTVITVLATVRLLDGIGAIALSACSRVKPIFNA
jgi:ATP-binding cassette subfamily C protein CydCD